MTDVDCRTRVLLVSNLFPTPVDAVRGVFLYQMAKNLAKLCDLTVVCPLPWLPNLPFLGGRGRWRQFIGIPRRYSIGDISVVACRYPMLPAVSESAHARLIAGSLKRVIARLHQDRPFDLVSSHWLYPDSVAVDRALSGTDIPHVPTGRGCDVNDFLDDVQKAPRILDMLGRASHITVVSEDMKRNLVEAGIEPDRVTAIPNGTDLDRFGITERSLAREMVGLSTHLKYVLYVGRFSHEKNVDVLARAAGSFLKSPDLRLVLVGDGPLESQFDRIVRNNGVRDQVIFAGRQPHAAVPGWINACDCLCLPSKREGSPNAVLESLACGTPVVASRVGSIPGLVGPESGVLVNPGDPQDLARGICEALDRRWDRGSVAAAVGNRTWDRVAEEYFRVFRAVLGREKVVV